MRLEIWQQFGKPAMQGLGGVAHGGKDSNATAGLPAQQTSAPYGLLRVAVGEVRRSTVGEERAAPDAGDG